MRTSRITTATAIALSTIAIAAPFLVFAQGNVTQLCTIITNATTLVRVFGTIILILAFIVLLYAAFLFVTAGGNEDAQKRGRQLVLYALIGLAVALLAIFADDIVTQLFGGTFLEGCPRPQGIFQ